jgi:hypothetical protein
MCRFLIFLRTHLSPEFILIISGILVNIVIIKRYQDGVHFASQLLSSS